MYKLITVSYGKNILKLYSIFDSKLFIMTLISL